MSQRFVKPDQPSVIFAPFLGAGGANAMASRLGAGVDTASFEKARAEASKVGAGFVTRRDHAVTTP